MNQLEPIINQLIVIKKPEKNFNFLINSYDAPMISYDFLMISYDFLWFPYDFLWFSYDFPYFHISL